MTDTGVRLLAPVKLLVVAGLFMLPWIRVSCVVVEDGESPKKFPMMSQTGLQTSTGGLTVDMMGGMMDGGGDELGGRGPKPPENAGATLLMKLFIALVLCGVLAGFALGLGPMRTGILAVCTGLAIALLGVQHYIGFPIVAELRESPPDMGGGLPAGGDTEIKFRVDYLPAYLGSWALCVAAFGVTLAESAIRQKPDDDDSPDVEIDHDEPDVEIDEDEA